MSDECENKYLDEIRLSAQDPTSPNFDLAKLLLSFIDGFVSGEVPCDFKEAALVLQAGTSAYGKKVENLHTMVTGLHNVLLQQEEERLQNRGVFKERAENEERIKNGCTEIIPGKNLSALKRRQVGNYCDPIECTKPLKRNRHLLNTTVPIELLPLEDHERGEIFYDTKGKPVGYSNDFAINRSHVTEDGWLIFDTFSPELIHSKPKKKDDKGHQPSYRCPRSQESGIESSEDPSSGISEDMDKYPLDDIPDDAPFKGLYAEMCANDKKEKAKNPKPKKKPEEIVAVRAPIGKECTYTLPLSLRCEKHELPPLEPIADFCTRHFFKSDKLPKAEDPLEINESDDDPYGLLFSCFANNSTLTNRLDELYGKKKDDKKSKEKKSKVRSGDSDETVDEGESGNNSEGSEDCSDGTEDGSDGSEDGSDGSEDGSGGSEDGSGGSEDGSGEKSDSSDGTEGPDELNVAVGIGDGDGKPANPGLEFDDIKIIRPPTHAFGGDKNLITDDIPEKEVPKKTEFELAAEFRRMQEDETAKFRSNVAKFPQEDVAEKIRIWQKGLTPFLEEIDTRDKFDINIYGSRILDAFENSNRRQTMTFRQFCIERDLEKYEAHRYFMALLPLANMGNVDLSNEPREGHGEQDDDIVITLLSRKMHHMDLEEFGHNSGEHK